MKKWKGFSMSQEASVLSMFHAPHYESSMKSCAGRSHTLLLIWSKEYLCLTCTGDNLSMSVLNYHFCRSIAAIQWSLSVPQEEVLYAHLTACYTCMWRLSPMNQQQQIVYVKRIKKKKKKKDKDSGANTKSSFHTHKGGETTMNNSQFLSPLSNPVTYT